jgi:hypothetical protein
MTVLVNEGNGWIGGAGTMKAGAGPVEDVEVEDVEGVAAAQSQSQA